MKILLLTGSINQGGAESQLLALANLLQRKGNNIQVLALTSYSYYLPYIKQNSINYSSIPNDCGKIQRITKAFLFIKQARPELVISYLKLTSIVAIASRIILLFRYKLIISERTSLRLPIYDLYYFSLALLANFITVNSTSKLTYIKKRFPLLKNRTVFIPNIVDIHKFLNVSRIKSSDGSIRLAFVGRISPEKNLLNLIKAIKMLVDKGQRVSLALYGEAKNSNYLMEVNQIIIKLTLKDVVKYVGPVKDVVEVYSRTDIVCLVSLYEGFSNVVAESLACGIPVVVSDIEENRYLIENEINGILVDPNDPVDISEGINQLVSLPPREILAISEKNRKKALEIFDLDTIYDKYITLINDTLR